MRFHVLAIPHTISSPKYNACAFTQKVVKFCKMMKTKQQSSTSLDSYNSTKSIESSKSTKSNKTARSSNPIKSNKSSNPIKPSKSSKSNKSSNPVKSGELFTPVKYSNLIIDDTHYIIHYGHEDSKVYCDEHVTVTDNQILETAYGSYNWKKNLFKHDINDHAHQTFYTNTVREIQPRLQRGDFILCFWGFGHKPIIDQLTVLGNKGEILGNNK